MMRPMLHGHFKMCEVPMSDTCDIGVGTPTGHFKIVRNLWKVDESDTSTHTHNRHPYLSPCNIGCDRG